MWEARGGGEQGINGGSKTSIKGLQQLSWVHIVVHSPTYVSVQVSSLNVISDFTSLTLRKLHPLHLKLLN